MFRESLLAGIFVVPTVLLGCCTLVVVGRGVVKVGRVRMVQRKQLINDAETNKRATIMNGRTHTE